MKIRKGFVSNSSSSSYICDVCGEAESGWDIGLDELEMVECENGHCFHEAELVNTDGLSFDEIAERDIMVEQKIDEDDPDMDDHMYEFREKLPKKYCPICQLQVLPIIYLLGYLLVDNEIDKKELLEEIRNRFKTYDELVKFAFPKD